MKRQNPKSPARRMVTGSIGAEPWRVSAKQRQPFLAYSSKRAGRPTGGYVDPSTIQPSKPRRVKTRKPSLSRHDSQQSMVDSYWQNRG